MFTLVVSANVSYDGALFGFWNLKLEFTNISLFFVSQISLYSGIAYVFVYSCTGFQKGLISVEKFGKYVQLLPLLSKTLVRFEKYAQHLLIYLYLIRNLHFDKYVQFVLKV